MNRMTGNIIAAALLCGAAALAAEREAAEPAAADAPRRASWDSYKPIVDRNIFLRDRTPKSSSHSSHSTPRHTDPDRTAPPTSGLILRGITDVDGTPVAFFEDRAGTTTMARTGDTLWHGRVKSVSLDEIEFEIDGKSRRIPIGYDLEGGAATASSAPAPSSGSSAGTTASDKSPAESAGGGAASAGSADEAAVLQRLREKRAKEEGR